jgi:hypothetical protein
MRAGYIKVFRKMLDSEVMQDDWLCRLWVWCLLKANWQESNGLGKGEFSTSRPRGSEELGVSGSRFYEGLMRLARLGCIEVKPNNKATTISICNFEAYQEKLDEKEGCANNKATTKQQQSNNKGPAPLEKEEEEEVKEVKETKKGVPPPVQIPAQIDTPNFSRSWSQWLDYRRKSRLSTRPETLNLQLVMLAGLGEEAAIESITNSIRCGWKGLFPPKGSSREISGSERQRISNEEYA